MALTDTELQNLRKSYKKSALSESSCLAEPLAQFQLWFQEAMNSEVDEPNAFILSTVEGGAPRARTVLLKGHQEQGIVFYTNYDSPKGQQAAKNPSAAATFLWLPLQRQVRIEGELKKVSTALSDQYFSSRPRGSQISAAASPQGQVVESREVLEKLFAETQSKYPDGVAIPRPPHWGGYTLIPMAWEFWQGRENRLHDRIRYRLQDGIWIKERLAP
jgi:pyridoxamine 5'-phosphate oxidase